MSDSSDEASDGAGDQIPPPTPSPAISGKITLEVGERKFNTTVETLISESDYFKAVFAGRWPVQKQTDGTCFIDADPDLFAHILRFMRQGTFPIFYDGENLDLGLYRALLDCAQYFQVTRLAK